MLVAAFIAYVIGSLMYIRYLNKRLKAYEHIWQQIEEVADHNEDGSFNINIQHLEEQDPFEVHADNIPSSGVRLLELDGNRTSFGGGRAA